jgi:predicted SAM-dependent methyltransferase
VRRVKGTFPGVGTRDVDAPANVWQITPQPGLDPLTTVTSAGADHLVRLRGEFYSQPAALAESPPLRMRLVHHGGGDLVMMSVNHAAPSLVKVATARPAAGPGRMRVEIGAGEKPDATYRVHTDVLALPGVVCRLDQLPFADGAVSALRANHVLEHQSWELVDTTLREWARVLGDGASLCIGVPDARLLATQWARGELSAQEANYWILGGHSDRPAHKGCDERGVPRWIWNAHHTLFDRDWLHDLPVTSGFTEIDVVAYAERNLRFDAVRSRGSRP